MTWERPASQSMLYFCMPKTLNENFDKRLASEDFKEATGKTLSGFPGKNPLNRFVGMRYFSRIAFATGSSFTVNATFVF